MATTTLLQRHAGEGETIAEAIRDCLDYGKDPEKTESGKYISAYECDPATVADEFLLAKASYAAMTGREQKKENNVLCYQIRQSFYPGEITPKEANRIGYELAMRWTKGRHAFIVTTHTDKQHIHCHIYYNSTTLDCTRKFRNFWGSSFALRRLSDRLCLENGLSIVENPKPRSKGKYRNYGEWQKDRKGPLSYQDRLRLAIDTALAERPADLDEFLNLMKRAGYEVKTVRGGGISFRLTGQGQERFTRLRASTLGDGYDLQDVLSAIEGKEKRPGRSERKISLAVDIQAKLAAGKGPGYERWAKVFNIKQMAAALAYIQDNGLTDYEQLAQKATEAADRFHTISEQIKQTEQAMKTNAGLKAATVQYAKTRPVFEQYKATKYSRKFLAEHEADLELYRAAQAEMRSLLGGAKLPMVPVFVLYFLWLKKLGRTQSFLHTAAVFVFGYYLFGLLTVTGIGFTSTMTFRPNISWTPFIGMITGPIDTILNIILFVPLGFFLPLLYKKYHHMKTVALTGFLFSLAVEIVQMFGWGSSDINDLMTNTAGACIGFLVYCLLSRILPANLKKQLQSSRVNAVAEVLLFAICTFAIMVTAQTWFVHDVLNVP